METQLHSFSTGPEPKFPYQWRQFGEHLGFGSSQGAAAIKQAWPTCLPRRSGRAPRVSAKIAGTESSAMNPRMTDRPACKCTSRPIRPPTRSCQPGSRWSGRRGDRRRGHTGQPGSRGTVISAGLGRAWRLHEGPPRRRRCRRISGAGARTRTSTAADTVRLLTTVTVDGLAGRSPGQCAWMLDAREQHVPAKRRFVVRGSACRDAICTSLRSRCRADLFANHVVAAAAHRRSSADDAIAAQARRRAWAPPAERPGVRYRLAGQGLIAFPA